jgi:hypothetical protein
MMKAITSAVKYLITAVVFLNPLLLKASDWQRSNVDWQLGSGTKIKAVYYPKEKEAKIFNKDKFTAVKKENLAPGALNVKAANLLQSSVTANIVESPPIDGFVPWLTVSVTDKRKTEGELDAVADSTIGNFLTAHPQRDFGIGIFDTGASSHIISYDDANSSGIYAADLVTENMIDIAGVTGFVSVFVSQPLGLFFNGLSAVDPCTLLINTANLPGEYNVSVSIAPPSAPDVPTAIGTPFSVYYTTVIDNTNQVTISRDNNTYSGPAVHFYDSFDPEIPEYPVIIPLELRPLGGFNVQYIITIDPFNLNLYPVSPSTIVGNLSQSIFFVSSVDLYENDNTALDKNRFMLDTGAQVTVIGSRIASRLRLNPNYPEFLVEISGIDGDVIEAPGFTIDRLVIPTLGEWFIATDVPVILLDVFSPEGGTVDGIIGMNLFTKFNMVLRGGGLFLQEDPTLEIEPIERIVADIAPEGGDGKVNFLDLQTFTAAWLSEGSMPPSPNWNPLADLAPQSAPDNIVNFLDFAVFAEHWLEQVS